MLLPNRWITEQEEAALPTVVLTAGDKPYEPKRRHNTRRLPKREDADIPWKETLVSLLMQQSERPWRRLPNWFHPWKQRREKSCETTWPQDLLPKASTLEWHSVS